MIKSKLKAMHYRISSSVVLVANVKVLCAVGDFGNGTFDLPQKPDRSTDAQLTTIAPIAQNTCYGLPFFNDKTLWAEYN